MRKKSLLTLPVVVLSILALLISVVPAFAMPPQPPTVDVDVTVAGGTSHSPPIIKCKWEDPDDYPLESDTQLDPVLWDNDEGYGPGQKQICYFAVVTDPQGVGDIRGIDDLSDEGVFADVYEPEFAGCTAWPSGGVFKYQVRLELEPWCNLLPPAHPCDLTMQTVLDLQAVLQGLYDDGRLTLNTAYFNSIGITVTEDMLYDIADELVQTHALLFKGCDVLDYHQPCGLYRVEVLAYDDSNDPSELLVNAFEYKCTVGVALDFTSINFGEVTVCVERLITGDATYNPGDGKPTIKNIGNVPAKVNMLWSDLYNCTSDIGLGMTGPDWNVEYDSRLGIGGTKTMFDPEAEKALPEILGLCNEEKLEFSVHVKKAASGCYYGEVVISGVAEPSCGP
jgi:hypothetical protein